jgi:hypothetical protein
MCKFEKDMIAIEQTFTPYLTGAKSFVHAIINLHLLKEFFVKYWIWILAVLAVGAFIIYKIKEHSRKEKERLQKKLEKRKVEEKPKTPQQIMNQLLNKQ